MSIELFLKLPHPGRHGTTRLCALGALAEAAPRIAEVDLNPVIVHQEGAGISLIDARVRLTK